MLMKQRQTERWERRGVKIPQSHKYANMIVNICSGSHIQIDLE